MNLERSPSRRSPDQHGSHRNLERNAQHSQHSYLQLPLQHNNDSKPPLKKSETISFSASRKLSNNSFIRMAKQASDTAFRTVGISRKVSDNNLNASQKNDVESSGVYEQNPKVYLYQQQLQKTIPARPQHRSQPCGDVSGDWVMNNQMLQSEPRQANEYFESLQNPASIDPSAAPDEPVLASTIDDHEQPLHQNDAVQSENSAEQIVRPQTPQRSSSRIMRNRTIRSRTPQQVCSDLLDHHQDQTEEPQCQQQQERLITKNQILSDESLPEYAETLTAASNKELPAIPSKPAPPSLPIASDASKNGSCGLIPQDVLKNMDSKDVKKAIKSTVIASRVYRVMTPEQLDILKKEQEELNDFVDSMHVSLHMECRMRDASHSLIRLHENNLNLEALKDATSQLQATSRRMDRIFMQTQEAMRRLLTIQRSLLQHEGAVLNAGLRRLDSENRELSRTVMQLDTARGQEKEEKIKWKKEHNRLKFQSVLFPGTPLPEGFTDKPVPSLDLQLVQQQHQAQLASMETYVKELNDDILHKDEKITDLSNQLQAVKDWTNDFESSVHSRKAASEESAQAELDEPLQKRLHQLQSDIENEFKEMDVQTQELRSKVDSLSEENSALVCNSKALLAMNEESHAEARIYQSRCAYRMKSHSRQGSDLRMVLQESLLELDRQIQLEESQSSSSSRPSSTSTSATAYSFDSFENNGISLSRRSSGKRSSGRSSRTQSSGSQSGLGLREQVLTRGFHFEDAQQESILSGSDDDTVVEDASVEIERLDSMVKELEAIALQRNNEIEAHE
ncbi:hypothetical protein BGX26_000501 [Mortierella sp. AD094]|nr:hypothetical protein BGX26_000501 [Mortierella sp. AD094]